MLIDDLQALASGDSLDYDGYNFLRINDKGWLVKHEWTNEICGTNECHTNKTLCFVQEK